MGMSRPADRKKQIGLAAQRLFHQYGYNAVGIDQVAAEVGIGGPAVYRHYRGKQDLLHQVVVEGLARFQDLAEDMARDQGPTLARDVLGPVAAEALDRRGIAALWQRETRYLKPDQQADVGCRLSKLQVTVERALFPGSNDDTCRLKAGALLSVLWSPSLHAAVVARPDFERILVDIAWKVVSAQLPPVPPPSAPSLGQAHTSPSRRASRRASRRELLLATASQLFAERGFASVSVTEIAEAAGTSAPSLYRQFTSKHELLAAALTRAAEALHLSLAQVLATSETASEAIELVVTSYVDVMLEHTDIVQLLASELNHLPVEHHHALRRTQREYVTEWLQPLLELRPDLSAASGRIVVHAALTVLNDVLRESRRDSLGRLRGPAIALAVAVLRPT